MGSFVNRPHGTVTGLPLTLERSKIRLTLQCCVSFTRQARFYLRIMEDRYDLNAHLLCQAYGILVQIAPPYVSE